MTIKKTLSNISSGAELTKPELSLNYLIAATVGVIVLMAAYQMGNTIFSRGSTLVQGRLAGVPTTDFKAALGIV